MADSDRTTLRELRRLRRDRRLGDIEWFDVAYRVYLFALGGTAVVVWASDFLDGLVDDVGPDRLLTRGPGLAGVLVALVLAVGLRQGAEGGPVSIEPGDVRHVLSAPIDRRTVLAEPTLQRARATAFSIAVPSAILGQLIGREVIGSRAAWAGATALFGVLLGVVFVSAAVIAHAARLPRPAASLVGLSLVGLQLASAVITWRADVDGRSAGVAGAGPFDLAGSIAFWGVRQRWIDVFALLAVVAVFAVAIAVCGRLRVEHLERRGQLVSQLRFAATTQDIRTVVLLRRQLSAETFRSRPWFARSSGARDDRAASRPEVRAYPPRPSALPSTHAGTSAGREYAIPLPVIARRGVASFRRFSSARLVRLLVLVVLAALSVHGAIVWSPLLLVATVLALYVLGLEVLEPLGQEIDRPDRTDALPVDRSSLYALHLLVPALAMVPLAMIGAAVVTALEPAHAPAAFALAVPVVWTGAIGSVVTTIGDALRPASVEETNVFGADRLAENPFAAPEFAGLSNVGRGLLPLILSAGATIPILAIDASPEPSTVVRILIGVALCLAVLVWWIRRRDRWAVGVRSFFVEGRAVQGLR